MNLSLRTAAVALLAASLVVPSVYAGDPAQPAKKHVATKKAKPAPKPTVEDQIEALRHDLESQINALKSDLAAKDAQLRQAEATAAEAKAEAAKAAAAASSDEQAVSSNTAAVSTLQSTVTDLKANSLSLATTVSDETAKMKKDIANPNVLHYKGISITPGGFVAAETVYRSKATGGDIPTPFSAIPYEHADAYSLSEFFGSARQSRITMLAEGKTTWGTLRGYYEADFLGTGISSNNNQSNSYVLRQRVIYAQAETNTHWTVAGGQLWSLATEQKKGITSAPGDVASPQTIDPNYVPGFAWTRQYGFRVVKTMKNAAVGVAIENPQLLYTASLSGNEPYAVLGSAGNNGGNYNAGISACSPATSIVNYSNQALLDSAGNTVMVAVPVYKTVNSCANVANLSFNQAPDVIAKIAIDPGWGHYELFGIGGFAHETVYPGETTDGNLYGGNKDVYTGAAVTPSLTTAANFSNSIKLGGFGGSLRVPVVANKVTFGVKALYGPGIGRYGNSTLADVTADANGKLAPIHNFSGLVTLEATPTPRLTLYLNYGGDYAGRADFATPTATTLAAPQPCFIVKGMTGCQNTFSADGKTGSLTLPSTLTGAEVAAGKWGGTWTNQATFLSMAAPAAVGYGSRMLNNSSCLSTTAPGYNGSSTGYYPGGSCGAQTRSVQEVTGGYWYDIYKGDRGRLRQGIQYGYAVREGWSGAAATAGGPGIGAKGIDNMFWTTFRYYLP
ncbi:MAG: hypothetical protein WCE75_06785 [Terracidiphilus sp.]